MKYNVKSVQVLMESDSGEQIVKTYNPVECCAVFWGTAGREFYVLGIERSGLSDDEKKSRFLRLNKIDDEAVINQEEPVFGKTTECVPK